MQTPPSLDIAGLEAVYDALATAIDKAGKEQTALFLTKLALLNAHTLGDPHLFNEHIDIALSDLK